MQVPLPFIGMVAAAAEVARHSDRESEVVLWTLAIAVVLALVHVAAAPLHGRLRRFPRITRSFGGGMAASYVFLQLMPEIDRWHEPIGARIHLLLLVGFIGFYAVDVLASRTRLKAGDRERVSFGARIWPKALYGALLLYTLHEGIHLEAWSAVLITVALSLHLLGADLRLIEEHPQRFRRGGRWLLAAAPLVGWLVAAASEPSEVVADVLLALLSGSVLYEVFRQEVPDPERSSLGWFVAGAALYATVWLAAMRG